MTLAAFFEAARPWLEGEGGLRGLGPTPSTDADLAFYTELLAWDQARILSELQPGVKTWAELAGQDWRALVRDYVRAHPPSGWSVPHVGASFADWLSVRAADDPRLAGIDALADLVWTSFRARTAPDEGPDLERRVFVRRYGSDPRAAHAPLARGELPGPTAPVTLVVFRHEESGATRVIPASLSTLAALLVHAGLPLAGALAALPPRELAAARAFLSRRGVLPHPLTSPELEESTDDP